MDLKKVQICRCPLPLTILLAFAFVLFCPELTGEQVTLLDLIKLPPGFQIEVYAGNVPNARSMALSPSGILFVGTRQEGKVYTIADSDKDNKADKVETIASGLYMPNGLAFRDGALYVAEVNRVLRFDSIEANLSNLLEPVTIINDGFPTD